MQLLWCALIKFLGMPWNKCGAGLATLRGCWVSELKLADCTDQGKPANFVLPGACGMQLGWHLLLCVCIISLASMSWFRKHWAETQHAPTMSRSGTVVGRSLMGWRER